MTPRLLKKALTSALGGLIFLSLIFCLVSACATVPLTGRSQLRLLPDSQMMRMSLASYREVLKKSKLSQDKKKVAMVRRVGKRIAGAAGDFMRENHLAHEINNYKWEFNLIKDDKTVNAWCMPGGKIAVYTGLLPISRDEAGLAVVMGHEVAHALAKHGNERMSQALLVQMGGVALAVALSEKPAETQALFMAAFGVGTTVGVMLPFSRRHEYEADRIGLTLMAKAGYDPRAAVGLWQRMKKAGKGKRPPKFLSTHPAPDSRIEAIKGFIPEALRHYNSANDTLPALKIAQAQDIRPMSARSEAARRPGIFPPCVQ